MSVHTTYVQKRYPDQFFASCRRCGSDPFPNRMTLAAAEADAQAHGELHHIYDREELARRERVPS